MTDTAKLDSHLDGDVDGVLGARQAGFERDETAVHHEDQQGAQQHPYDIRRGLRHRHPLTPHASLRTNGPPHKA